MKQQATKGKVCNKCSGTDYWNCSFCWQGVRFDTFKLKNLKIITRKELEELQVNKYIDLDKAIIYK